MIYDIKIKNFGPFGEEDKNNYLTVNFYYSSISNPIINIIGDNNSGKSCLLSIINWPIKWQDKKYYKNFMKSYKNYYKNSDLIISYIFNETQKVIVSKKNECKGFFSTIGQRRFIPFWYIDKEYDNNKDLFENKNIKINENNWQKINKDLRVDHINNVINQ